MPISTKSGTPDGVFGPETATAVKAFQTSNGLVPDGLVGRDTIGRLDRLGGGKAVGQPEIVNDEASLGKRVADEMKRINQNPSGPDKGVWYDFNYFRMHQKDPSTYPWNDDWRSGLASPAHFDRTGRMKWTLKPGQSASAAIKAWLHGLTIAECLSAIVAIEIETLRAAIGDTEFDRRYGQAGGVAAVAPLLIHMGTEGTPVQQSLTFVKNVKGSFGKRDLKVGDWVYFYNHPRYLLKHPGGAFQGENAVYIGDDAVGRQLFTGLGVPPITEAGMLTEMAEAYNVERNGDDYVRLLNRYARNAPEVKNPNRLYLDHDTAYTRRLYQKYISNVPTEYRESSGEFPIHCDGKDIHHAPKYTLNGVERKGGFTGNAARLDPSKV